MSLTKKALMEFPSTDEHIPPEIEEQEMDIAMAEKAASEFVVNVRFALEVLAKKHDWSPEQRAQARQDFMGADMQNELRDHFYEEAREMRGGVA